LTQGDQDDLAKRINKLASDGLISTADRDIRLDNLRNASSDTDLDLIRREIDRFGGVGSGGAAIGPTQSSGSGGTTPPNAVVRVVQAQVSGVPRILLIGVLLLCVLTLGVMASWAYLSMDSVMAVGGSCASGGPYEIQQECPPGSNMLMVAIPSLIFAALIGSGVALMVATPELVTLMWFLIFSSLGWGFIRSVQEYDAPSSMLTVGVVFFVMAVPALPLMVFLGTLISRVRIPAKGEGLALRSPLIRTLLWVDAYAVIAGLGFWLGLGWWDRIL
jgi:hypothetical protein